MHASSSPCHRHGVLCHCPVKAACCVCTDRGSQPSLDGPPWDGQPGKQHERHGAITHHPTIHTNRRSTHILIMSHSMSLVRVGRRASLCVPFFSDLSTPRLRRGRCSASKGFGSESSSKPSEARLMILRSPWNQMISSCSACRLLHNQSVQTALRQTLSKIWRRGL